MSLMPEILRDREHERRHEHDRRQPLEHAAEHQEDHDRDHHEDDPAAGQAFHDFCELLGEAGLRQRPGHGERRAEDQQDRAAQRRGLDEHA
jgi:hypothetical protein